MQWGFMLDEDWKSIINFWKNNLINAFDKSDGKKSLIWEVLGKMVGEPVEKTSDFASKAVENWNQGQKGMWVWRV